MTRADWVALLISILGIIFSFLVADRVFERIPHLEDEIAYVWQARVISEGELTVETPPEPKKFLVPFVVDYEGRRFGKYPLGWPAVLAVGVKLGIRGLINPLLAGLGLWFIYRLSKQLMGETVGLLSAGLTLFSPFFLMNSGSLLSHPLGLVLSAGFVIAWWDVFSDPESPGGWLAVVTGASALGVFALSRPYSAIAVAVPFGFHGIYLLARGPHPTRWRVLAFGGIALMIASIYFLWQYAVTGDPFLNPYTLWWSYDKVGFGPGIGVTKQGHNLDIARVNTRFSLWVGSSDMFGWPIFSWVFLPFGLWAARRNKRVLLTASVFLSLVVFYLAYWIGSWLFGPRYYYEGFYSLTLISAGGIAFLAGWPISNNESLKSYSGWNKYRSLGVTAVLALLLAGNLFFYLPMRLEMMRGLYGIERSELFPFRTPEAQKIAPASIIVHPRHWTDYGTFIELESPFFESPFVFTFGNKPGLEKKLKQMFPEREIYHYYPDEPYKFYRYPRE